MVAHHFGMFDFNAADPDRLRTQAAHLTGPVTLRVPEIGKAIIFGGR